MPKITTIELQEEIKTIKEAISNIRAETEKLEEENAELRNRNNKLKELIKQQQINKATPFAFGY